MSCIIRGKVIRNVERVSLHASYGECPFIKIDDKWVDPETGKPCKVMKLSEFLTPEPQEQE